MPFTFMVIVLICAKGTWGSAGAEAMMKTVPVNPEHWAMPVMELMVTPTGGIDEDIAFPIDHITGVDAVMGAMLKFPIAVN